MPLPQPFYYTQAQNKPHFVSTDTGNPSINRLIQGKSDYWISASQSKIKKQKKMILADWTARSWPYNKTKHIQTKISALMKEGFEFYLWQKGYVTLLTQSSLSCLIDHEIRSQMMPKHIDDVVLNAITQHSFTQDEVLVIDDYWMEQILHGKEEPQPRHISLHTFSKLNPEEKTSILNLIQHAKPALSLLILDCLPQDKIDLKTITDQFPELETRHQIEHLSLGKTSSSEAVAAMLNKHPLEKIKTLIIPAELLMDETCGLLLNRVKNVEAINVLSLVRGIIANPELNFRLDFLAFTENIQLSYIKTDASTLKHLFSAAPKLKTLNLDRAVIASGVLKLLPGSLPALESLSLRHARLDPETFATILRAAPNLFKLNIPNTKLLVGALLNSTTHLANLECLSIDGSDVTPTGLERILIELPKLRQLNIGVCEHLYAGHIDFQSKEFPNLSEVTVGISGEIDSFSILQSLLLAATALKKVTISADYEDYEHLDDMIFPPNSLPSINEIHLYQFNIQYKEIETLLLAANHIKKLKINDCMVYKKNAEPSKSSLTVLQNLERLEIEGSMLCQAEIKKIIKAAPNLKSLLFPPDSWEHYDESDDELRELTALFSSNTTQPLSPEGNTSNSPPTALPPIHDPKQFINFQPMPTEVSQFKYHGTEKNKSQRMLIEKLSQYFTLTKQNRVIIPKLQDGICTPLACYFLKNPQQFYVLMDLTLV